MSTAEIPTPQPADLLPEPWIECVLNFSEGRRPAVIERVEEAVTETTGVWLLGSRSDPDHNRTVCTFVSRGLEVVEAAHRIVLTVAEEVDLREQQGVHPRIGAVDVIPFVPLGGAPPGLAIEAATTLGHRLGHSPGVPVFLYEDSASAPHRRNLAAIRRQGSEGLLRRMQTPEWIPDFGPPMLHPRLGAVAVGARGILIAYNIYLATNQMAIARRIAALIRESNGGLPAVKALGLYLPCRDQVQISMNLTDFRITGLYKVTARVGQEAARAGTKISSSEIIGFVPAEALFEGDPRSLKLETDSPYLLERRINTVIQAGG